MENLIYHGECLQGYAPAAFKAAMKEAGCLVVRRVNDKTTAKGIYAFDNVAVKYECSPEVTITLFGPEKRLGEVEKIVLRLSSKLPSEV